MKGLLGSNVIGVYTREYKERLLSCAADCALTTISMNQLEKRIDVFPVGVDAEALQIALADRQHATGKLLAQFGGRQVILSVDRLDPTKGILHKLRSFEYFLQKYPSMQTRVHLVMIVAPSRLSLSAY